MADMMKEWKSDVLEMPIDLYGRSDCAQPRTRAQYLWLVYSFFFFIEPILRHSAKYWAEQMPVYALFLGLYVAYVQIPRNRVRLWIVAAMFVMGVLAIPNNVGGSSFYIYVAALLPFCVDSKKVFLGVMATEIAALAVESQLFPGNPFNYLITGFFVVVVGLSNSFIAENKRADMKLRAAQVENVELAAVAERERIARDLHDVLGHTLSVVVLKAELAGRLIGRDNARAAAEIADVERTARTALAEVREAIGGYRARGLSAEVEQARQTLRSAGVTLACESAPPSLRAREETVLSLAVREAVTNIVRHARATECSMRFGTAADGFATLEVADNGAAAAGPEGNGLRGMRERVQELGGRFVFTSGAGTRLLIELPRVR